MIFSTGCNALGGRSAQANGDNPPGQTGSSQDSGQTSGQQQTGGSQPGQVVTGTVMTSFNLLDGRSFDARTTVPNASLGYAPYEDTGIGKFKSWTRNVPAGWTLIAGGVALDDGIVRYDKGIMKVYPGPTNVTVRITDGFVHVVPSDQAPQQVCVRAAQHYMNGWLLTRIDAPAEYANTCAEVFQRK